MRTLSRKLPPSTLEVIHAITGEEVMPSSRLAQHVIGLIYAVDPTVWARKVDLCLHGGDPLLLARRLARLASSSDFRAAPRVAVVDDDVFSGAPLAALEDNQIVQEMVSAGELPGVALRERTQASEIIRAIIKRDIARVIASGMEVLWIDRRVQGARDRHRNEIVLRLSRQAEEAAMLPGLHAAGGPAQGLFEQSQALDRKGRVVLRRELRPVLKRVPKGDRFADILVASRLEVFSGFVSPGRHPEAVMFDARFMQEIGAEVFRLAQRVPTSVEDAIADWRADLRRVADLVAG